MEEDSRKYWIIPIVCFIVIAGIIFPYSLVHKYDVVLPNAAIEREEMKNMTCPQIMAKDSLNNYWNPTNSKIGRDMTAICKELIKKESTGISPYVEFCSTEPLNPPFWPDKDISNSTHWFNHETCLWISK
jgi:hypothetical protein